MNEQKFRVDILMIDENHNVISEYNGHTDSKGVITQDFSHKRLGESVREEMVKDKHLDKIEKIKFHLVCYTNLNNVHSS